MEFKRVAIQKKIKTNLKKSIENQLNDISYDTVYYGLQVDLTFDAAGIEILKCNHLNKQFSITLPFDTDYYGVHGGSNIWVCG